jgi:hypothetical protein
MNDESMVAQGTVPNQAAAEALQAIVGQNHYAGGNALLSAEAKAGAETDHSPIDQPAATNTPSNPAKAHLTVEQLSDEENLSLINDVASAE